MRGETLHYGNIARSAGESVAPELWPDHAWVPALGCTGGTWIDVVGGHDYTLPDGATWTQHGTKFAHATYLSITLRKLPNIAGYSWVFGIKAPAPPATGPNVQPLKFCGHDIVSWDHVDAGYVGAVSGAAAPWPKVKFTSSAVRTLAFSCLGTVNTLADDAGLVGAYSYSSSTNTGIVNTNSVATLANYEYGLLHIYHHPLNVAELLRVAADPLLPFRRRRSVKYFIPAAGGFKPSWWTPPKLIGAGY